MKESKYLMLFPLLFVKVSVFTLLSLLLTGCDKTTETDKKDSSEINQPAVVAIIDNRSISTAEFMQYLAEKNNHRRMTEDKLVIYLEEMIREEILYQQAKKLKLDKIPEIQQKFRQILSQRLIEDQVNRKVWEQKVDDNELRAAYKERIEQFNRPEQIRISILYAALAKDATKQQTEQARKKFTTAFEELKKSKQERRVFGNLQRKYSDTHPNLASNNTAFFDAISLPNLPDKIIKAAFEIERVGKSTDHIIEADDGLYIIMLTGKRTAINRTLQSVQPQLERQIRKANLTSKRKKFIEDLHNKADVEINSAALSKLVQELNLRGSKKQRITPPALPKLNSKSNRPKNE